MAPNIMSKYFLINLSGTGSTGAVSIYLTNDGTVTGRPCKAKIPEAALLLTPESGNTTNASDGSPFTERPLTGGLGRPFTIEAAFVQTAIYDDLKDLIDHSAANDLAIRVQASGVPGSIDVDGIPNFAPFPISWDDFNDYQIKGLKMQFMTSAVN